jgi:hypothetical protein
VINFRYHVVSLTAVFLALAIGLVLGTAALNGPVADNLSNQVSGLRESNGQLRGQVDELQTRAASQDEFVRTIAPTLLTGRLTGRSVIVLSTPGADTGDRDDVVKQLQTAGATVTGRARLTDDFIDPARDDALQDLATRVVPAGVTTLPNNGVGVETASALLAAVLVSGQTTVTSASRTSVLAAFTGLGVLTLDGEVSASAPAVVVITGSPSTGSGSGERNNAVLALIRQFDKAAAQIVVSAPNASGSGSAIGAIRDDDALTKSISTVDGVGLAEGQVATALALAEQFDGKSGQYGTGDGATARIPTLAK